ncbi:TetR/AcrR family transcriptional regulator [Acidobacterium sp. S8]|uniref:TetR/AcrR family transcriptional regulator n=1 Tax=Acidobacterium sp. S8 TaxID=1641854 RepID=UPI00131ABFE5|nr:TetR family transcriptional regulator [Acidobacterium sp. S8]
MKRKNPRNSGATKARILEAAREAFATLGYERATVRTIAEMADIHPSMIMRYYTSKETLFAASSQFSLQLPDFAKADRPNAGELIVHTFLDRWENRGAAGDLPALLRLSVTHPDGREKLITVYTQQVKPALDRLIPPKQRARVAILIATQLVGLAFLRYVLQLPAAVELTEEEIVKSIGNAIQSYIDAASGPR